MTRHVAAAAPADDAQDAYRAFSIAVDRMRQGEQVVALINPDAMRSDATASSVWLSARLSISELQRVLLPDCDERCSVEHHDPHAFVVVADLALDITERRRRSWWSGWNDSLQRDHRRQRLWYAGSPILPDTPTWRRLRAGTRLTRITSTDPSWVHYDGAGEETLYSIESGDNEGDALIAASFGLSPLLPGFAGALIAPDHPPTRDTLVATRMLTAGWAAIERGLPFEG